MKQQFSVKRMLAAAMALLMVISLLPASALSVSAETKTYVLDTTNDLQPMAQGEKSDGDYEVIHDFFTINYSAKNKIDGSKKNFDDGYYATQRLNFGGKTTKEMYNSVMFKVNGPATIKLWWVSGGDGREMALYNADCSVIQTTDPAESVKNSLYIDQFKVDTAGTYYIGVPTGSNYLFKLEVTVGGASSEPVSVTHVLDTTSDLQAMAQGEKSDGDYEVIHDYFTINYSAKNKIDGSEKNFDDGYYATQRLNFGGKTTSEMYNTVMFTTSGAATIKLWWVSGGDGREMALYNSDCTVILSTNPEDSVKNSLYIDSFKVDTAGTYYIGVPTGSNYLFKLEVTETTGGAVEIVRKDWSKVEAPVITEAADNGSGTIEVTVNAVVGNDGGDEVIVTMYDSKGNELSTRRSIAEKSSHTVKFQPEDSGTYTFKAVLNRDGETGKKTAEGKSATFSYPLGAPVLTSVTSKGGGKIAVEWVAVHEAESYEIYCGGKKVGTSKSTSYTVTGLTVGTEYSFYVIAVRGSEKGEASGELSTKATRDEQKTWGFNVNGPSTNTSSNGYEGSINDKGWVTVYSEGGKGKIQPNSADGVAFYYTAVPTEYNFTLRAKVTVDSWTYSNGQEGFGLLATDMLGTSGDSSSFYNNSYLVGCTKIEYRFEGSAEGGKVYDVSYANGTKYSMKLGLGVIERTGVTKKNQANFADSDAFKTYSKTTSLEWAAGSWEKEAGTYNIVGNETSGNIASTNIDLEMKTSFILEIQKNNTGYFVTYYDEAGMILSQQKYYDPDALSNLDKDNVYVGFFASRNARATFSDVTMTTILASEDAPAEEKPVTKIDPTVSISSGANTTKQEYELLVDTNVSGTLEIQLNYATVLENIAITGGQRESITVSLAEYGQNSVKAIFTPDPDQDLGEDTVLSTTTPQSANITVVWNKGNYHLKTIYVSPDLTPEEGVHGNGTLEFPYDIYTAVANVVPGQTIVLLEGTYKLPQTLRIERGMDGTADAPIRMIADPAASTRPVLDFQQLGNGIVHGGNYWYFYGFDVTNSAPGQKGFQVSGSYNVLDQINAYHNGNSGIQISRMYGSDLLPYWPAHNLILNCTSYGNCDPGYEDADGFAAKLTCGEGNILDGCVAYNNADDGYDLYAKNETGPIGTVTIRNSLAYANGYLEDGTDAGNGNGFKMGGDSISGYHVLENCYAFYNKAKGIDSNSCPDIQVYNCVSYNNGSHNVAFYTNVASRNTDYFATGLVSFRNPADTVFGADVNTGEKLSPQGTQDKSKYTGKTNYYWSGSSVNSAGDTITADMFVSLTFTGFTRNADGTINMNGFLQLNDKAPSGVGVIGSGTPSSETVSVLEEDLEHNYPDSWFNEDPEVHWQECDCGARGNLSEHTFEWIIDKEATPEETGLKHKECTVCGHKKTAITTYYEEPVVPSEPATEPSGTEATQNPTQGTAEPQPKPQDNSSTVVIIIAAVVAVLAIGAIVVIKFVLPKVKKSPAAAEEAAPEAESQEET